MKRSGRRSYHFCRIILGAFFVYAGALKIFDAPAFAGQVAAYRILPYQWNYFVAATLPWIEVLCGGLLLVNRKVRPASLVVGVLTAVFMVVLGSVIIRGLNIDCGCFGPHIQSTPQQALLRNVLILALSHFVFHLRNKYSSKESEDRRQKTE
ncbi:MAG: DoxX family membrane protein [Desulfuromonadales bacterium]|nr:DoxX family membrane protein [Desulfuromonadales bacterium]